MNAIHIRKKLDSTTLPELEGLIGKTVTITIEEAVPESLEQRFQRLKMEWDEGAADHSNPSIIMSHPAMRAIVAMGDDVVPLILREMAKAGNGQLAWALREITGENIAPPLMEGGFAKWNMREQIEAWSQCGRQKGLV